MPQLRGVLNAFSNLRRRAAARLGFPRPGDRLDPPSFLAHAGKLASRAPPPPPGLWLSLIGEIEFRAQGACVEYVRAEAGDFADAVRRARAPFVAKLDSAGRLAPFAAQRIAAALAAHPDVHALYTDEIETDARGRPVEVVLKPAFDPVLFQAFDYFGCLAVYARERVLSLGATASDHELALRIAGAAPPGAILHLPFPAYLGPARALAVVAPARPTPRTSPKVSVIIPSRDAPALIAETLAGLFERTDYPDFDVTIVDNGSTDPTTLALYERYAASARFRVEVKPAPFNFSRAINRGARLSDGPLLLLLNNDIEIAEPGWLKEMVACFDYPQVGIVGVKLLYPDGTLQHAGVIAGLGDYAGHWYIGCPESELGPQRRLAARQTFSVVTGACMLVSRACFDALSGFDEETFPIAYNDVDFCLRAGAAGYRVLWTPFARLVHHESASRGSDETDDNRGRFARDKAALQARHRTDVLEDRAYNPWAVRSHSDPWPVARASLPEAR